MRGLLAPFAGLNFLVLLLNGWAYLKRKRPLVMFSYFLHFAALAGMVYAAGWAAARGRLESAVAGYAVPAVFGLFQAYLFADKRVYSLFGFHVNPFVVRVLSQADARKVLGLSWLDLALILGIGPAFMAAEIGAMHGLAFAAGKGFFPSELPVPAWAGGIAAGLLVFAVILERLRYAFAYYRGEFELTELARALPFYVGVTMSRFFSRHFVPEEDKFSLPRPAGESLLDYPKCALPGPPPRPLNLLLIMLESWRADSFSAEVMPNVWKLAERGLVGRKHFSGGNGTRFGVFSFFCGLNGFYYDYFHDERRKPFLLEILESSGYAMRFYASASLKFLGLRDAVLSQFLDRVEDDFDRRADKSDVVMNGRFLDWVGEEPFCAWLFYDATHPRFTFPPEFARFRPYLERIDALSLVPERRDELFNRYRNSLLFVDSLIGDVLGALDARGMLERTVVVVTSDHGAEFWEHGHFTHSSAFTDEQTRVPIVLGAPGLSPRVLEGLTVHEDVPATLLELLGYSIPREGYTQGRSMLQEGAREWVLLRGWADYCLADDEHKISFLVTNMGASYTNVYGPDDEPVRDPRSVIRSRTGKLLEAFQSFGEFLK